MLHCCCTCLLWRMLAPAQRPDQRAPSHLNVLMPVVPACICAWGK